MDNSCSPVTNHQLPELISSIPMTPQRNRSQVAGHKIGDQTLIARTCNLSLVTPSTESSVLVEAFTNEANLGLQLNAKTLPHPMLDMLHQRQHIITRCLTEIDDKICMP